MGDLSNGSKTWLRVKLPKGCWIPNLWSILKNIPRVLKKYPLNIGIPQFEKCKILGTNGLQWGSANGSFNIIATYEYIWNLNLFTRGHVAVAINASWSQRLGSGYVMFLPLAIPRMIYYWSVIVFIDNLKLLPWVNTSEAFQSKHQWFLIVSSNVKKDVVFRSITQAWYMFFLINQLIETQGLSWHMIMNWILRNCEFSVKNDGSWVVLISQHVTIVH